MNKMRIEAEEGTKFTRATVVDGGKAIEAETVPIVLKRVKDPNQEYIERIFPIIPAESLRLEDEFLRYNPTTEEQNEEKRKIMKMIRSGVLDFRIQIMDPSVDSEGNLYFEKGCEPALGKSPLWWENAANDFLPQYDSALLQEEQEYIFHAFLIKELIKKGYSKEEAWYTICNDSKSIGNYINGENYYRGFEKTGSRRVGIWFDVATPKKIIKGEADNFLIARGTYEYTGDKCTVISRRKISDPTAICCQAVGVIALNKVN